MVKVKKIIITWEEFERQRKLLVKQIKQSKIKFKGIFAIPKGGLTLGVCLAHDLQLPLLKTAWREDILVVDEISDFGKTLHKYYKRNKIAVLTSTAWTKSPPDFFVSIKKDKGDWIQYPWEKQ